MKLTNAAESSGLILMMHNDYHFHKIGIVTLGKEAAMFFLNTEVNTKLQQKQSYYVLIMDIPRSCDSSILSKPKDTTLGKA